MLVTILVVCFLRPLLRCPIQRKRTISFLLIGAWLFAIHSDLKTSLAQAPSTLSSADPTAPANDHSVGTDLTAGSDSSAARMRLREGMSIPPTIGYIVKLGRRWAFMPVDPHGNSDDQSHVRDSDTENSSATTSASTDAFNAGVGRPITPATNPADIIRSPQQLSVQDRQSPSKDPLATEPIDSLQRKDSPDHSMEGGASRMMILCENQMLQRIVEASDSEDSNDRWQISGEILEYFNQNRLLIRTIQRASTSVDPPQPASAL